MNQAIESTNGSNGAAGHEHREANVKMIVYAAIGLAATILIVMLLVWGGFNVLKTNEQQADRGEPLSPLAQPFQVPPEPRLEVKPWMSLLALRDHEQHALTTYGWQDQKAGIVRIPIERAMDLLAERGLPQQQKQQQPRGAKNAK
jgi:hypothetical protein